ncbi:hypothetical protein [Emticicia sp. TH156]|uniref:hypothetical protein n=1 Tax=Emticicia sp. TH156 TaxID=2067454 RepID=UPI000C765F8C|nr:hypothetical protein [Emticicia sp. TH156]PLK45316.1 hypothetical protein C0V77_04000 [Emticicia sp. TH156]
MKTSSFRILALAVMMLPAVGFSQQNPAPNQQPSPCNSLPYKVFQGNADRTPVVLKRLGTSPQFGEIPKHTAKSAFDHLKRVYKKNQKGIKKEMDDMLAALGYTGINDPAFTVGSLTPEILPKGSTGWMGAYAKGHKYSWSILGNNFETFKLKAKTGDCFIYIMKKCGNAFYIPVYIPAGPVVEPTRVVDQQVSISAKGEIASGDVMNASKTLEIVAVNGNKGVSLGTYPVKYRATYDYSVKGEMAYSKTIPVCVTGNETVAPVNLMLPLALDYKITKSDVTVGEGDKIYLNVDEKQFKNLSKAYKTMDVTPATSATPQSIEKKVLSATTANDATIGTTGASQCADQRVNFTGKSEIQDGSIKTANPNVTIIGVYKKTGKLAVGETPEKYLCLGSFPVPVKSGYEVVTTGSSSVSKAFRVANASATTLPDVDVNIPVSLTYSFTKQDVTVGDYNKIYVTLDEGQYKKLLKKYSRCCSDGSCIIKK